MKITANGTTTSPVPRGDIDPFIGISFKLGPAVGTSGALPDGRRFKGVREFQALAAADSPRLLANLARQLAVYATGRGMNFRDRTALAGWVARTQEQGGGIRILFHELIQDPLFHTR